MKDEGRKMNDEGRTIALLFQSHNLVSCGLQRCIHPNSAGMRRPCAKPRARRVERTVLQRNGRLGAPEGSPEAGHVEANEAILRQGRWRGRDKALRTVLEANNDRQHDRQHHDKHERLRVVRHHPPLCPFFLFCFVTTQHDTQDTDERPDLQLGEGVHREVDRPELQDRRKTETRLSSL